MDDLLITRRSERVRERYSRTRSSVPMGSGFGMACGIALGFCLAAALEKSPHVGLLLGLALGAALGGLFGKFIRSPREFKRADFGYHYEGIPISEDPDSADSEEEKPES